MARWATTGHRRTQVRVFEDEGALTRAAADELLALMAPAKVSGGSFHLALAGGSTPIALYQRLAASSVRSVWAETHLWFGDERYVPPDHADSNFRMAREHLIDPLGLPQERVHPVPTSSTPEADAERYEASLRAHLTKADGSMGALDLVLLGVGEDGHTASLFPGTAALAEQTRWVVANWVPKLQAARITLTFPALFAAKRLWVFAVGDRKQAIVNAVLGAPPDSGAHPVATLTDAQGQLAWWVDEAARGPLRV